MLDMKPSADPLEWVCPDGPTADRRHAHPTALSSQVRFGRTAERKFLADDDDRKGVETLPRAGVGRETGDRGGRFKQHKMEGAVVPARPSDARHREADAGTELSDKSIALGAEWCDI